MALAPTYLTSAHRDGCAGDASESIISKLRHYARLLHTLSSAISTLCNRQGAIGPPTALHRTYLTSADLDR